VRSSSFLGDHYEHDTQLCTLSLTVQTTVAVSGSSQWAYVPPTECAVLDTAYVPVQSNTPRNDAVAVV
jgi:hypothetical protein